MHCGVCSALARSATYSSCHMWSNQPLSRAVGRACGTLAVRWLSTTAARRPHPAITVTADAVTITSSDTTHTFTHGMTRENCRCAQCWLPDARMGTTHRMPRIATVVEDVRVDETNDGGPGMNGLRVRWSDGHEGVLPASQAAAWGGERVPTLPDRSLWREAPAPLQGPATTPLSALRADAEWLQALGEAPDDAAERAQTAVAAALLDRDAPVPGSTLLRALLELHTFGVTRFVEDDVEGHRHSVADTMAYAAQLRQRGTPAIVEQIGLGVTLETVFGRSFDVVSEPKANNHVRCHIRVRHACDGQSRLRWTHPLCVPAPMRRRTRT